MAEKTTQELLSEAIVEVIWQMNLRELREQFRLCECGWPMSKQDTEFWGECLRCREKLPIQTLNNGDKSGAATDRKYHGGQGWTAEW